MRPYLPLIHACIGSLMRQFACCPVELVGRGGSGGLIGSGGLVGRKVWILACWRGRMGVGGRGSVKGGLGGCLCGVGGFGVLEVVGVLGAARMIPVKLCT